MYVILITPHNLSAKPSAGSDKLWAWTPNMQRAFCCSNKHFKCQLSDWTADTLLLGCSLCYVMLRVISLFLLSILSRGCCALRSFKRIFFSHWPRKTFKKATASNWTTCPLSFSHLQSSVLKILFQSCYSFGRNIKDFVIERRNCL